MTLPLWWGAAPTPFPREGLTWSVRFAAQPGSDNTRIESVTAVADEDAIAIHGDLDDGSYAIVPSGSVHIAYDSQYFRVVEGRAIPGLIPGRGVGSVVAYHMIDVRIVARFSRATEAEVSAASTVTPDFAPHARWSGRFTLRHAQEINTKVPATPLRFSESHKWSNRTLSQAALKSSLDDRVPRPGELIELTVRDPVTLTINLVESVPGDLQSVLDLVSPGSKANDRVPELDVSMRGWIVEGRQSYRAQWEVPPSAGMPASLSIEVLPLSEPTEIILELLPVEAKRPPGVRSTDGRGPALFQKRCVAFALKQFAADQAHYTVDATVMTYNWDVTVTVTEAEHGPRANFLVSIDPRLVIGEERISSVRGVPEEYELRTNSDGVARFVGLPSTQGAWFRLQLESTPPRELNPDLKTWYQYEAGTNEIEIQVVLNAEAPKPLTLKFELSSPNPDRSRLQHLKGIVVPHTENERLAEESLLGLKQIELDDKGRWFTEVYEPGRYTIFMLTSYGELVHTVNYSGDGEQVIRVHEPRHLAVTCLDQDSIPLDDAIIFTTVLDAQYAWALASLERAPFALQDNGLRRMSRQTTNVDGECKFPVQPDNAEPAEWLIHHPQTGLARLTVKSSAVVDGVTNYVVAVANTLDTGDIEIHLPPEWLSEGGKVRAVLTHVFKESAGKPTELVAAIGWQADITSDKWTVAKVPVGRYALSILVTGQEGNTTKVRWAGIVEVKAGVNSIANVPPK